MSILRADELERLLIEADARVVLVSPRLLRRVIKKHNRLGSLGLQVPHHKSYVLGRDELLAIASRDELDLAPACQLPDVVLLLPQPDAGRMESLPREEVLLKYRRLLFHARVHAALHERRRAGQLDEAAVRERIRRIGYTEFAEATAVLRQEHYLLPPGDDVTRYEEFAALYLELRHFDPEALPRYFPSVEAATVERVLAEDVDVRDVAACSLAGSVVATVVAQSEGVVVRSPDRATETDRRSPEVRGDLRSEDVARSGDRATTATMLATAERAAATGNLVRAALLRVQASAKESAEQTVDQLVEHLHAALHFHMDDIPIWRRTLTALLEPAATGVWPIEARLLFDLQKVCLDHERAVYAADLVEWVVSWGKQPIKRLLPHQGDVLVVKHLRIAIRLLASARLDEALRHDFDRQLHTALHHAQEQLRNRLRPAITEALDKVEMRPDTAAEEVARAKLVEELLDRIVERGFLNLGDLRDAIARNRLKMPDLAGPSEFFRGDRLLRANRRLAENLDGVYRRGEIYLRWLQRLNSVAFGTGVGRFLTRYLALPFGCAFVALEGTQHLLDLVLHWTGVVPAFHALGGATGPAATLLRPHLHLTQWWSVAALGLLLLALLYWTRFRRGVVRALHTAYRGGRALLVDLPAFVLRIPLLQAIFQNRTYLLFYQYLLKPLVYSAPVGALLFVAGTGAAVALYGGVAMFLAMTLLFNSPLGQQLEEVANDGLVRGWHLVSVDLFPGLFRWLVFVSRQFLEGVNRLLYTVDEWLRFRQGQSEGSFYVKVVLGLAWFLVTYVVRFVINLLVEPQINPIKHFPVVTVSHKLVMTMLVPPLAHALSLTMDAAPAMTIAVAIGFGIPGIFGFLVWELKENWKLYRANQSPTLNAEMVGSHGETVLRLLRPGFHSGTLPKLYAKLRRAKGRSLHKHTEALHHIIESVERFVERTLLKTLAGSRRWGLGAALRVVTIQCGCNRIRIELACVPLPGETLLLDLEEHAGWLVAGVARRGWLASLNAAQAEAWTAALTGFYKLAGVDVVREQVAALLPPDAAFALTEAGLIVWLGDTKVRYDLNETETLEPMALRGSRVLPRLQRRDVLFSETDLRWSEWVETWERDRHGK